jgi:hypothetical protein
MTTGYETDAAYAAAVTAPVGGRRRSWLADVEMSTVIVLTTADVSFRGLRAAVHDDCLVLSEAVLMGDESNTVLNGNVVIPRERVLAVQVVAP